MRAAGTFLTILALVLVQAPWIVCACSGDTSLTSLLTGVIAHDAGGHGAHGGHHAHHCCDGIAHAVHGADHAHGVHCHGTFGHTHEDEESEAPADRHDGFQLALRTLPGDVHLDNHAPIPGTLPAWLDDAWPTMFVDAEVVATGPPERPTLSATRTERLLL